MRVLLKDSFDGRLMLMNVDRAFASDFIKVDTDDGCKYYKYPSVLTFTIPESARTVHVIMSEDECRFHLETLLRRNYVDLTEFGDKTFIFLDEEHTEQLLKVAGEPLDILEM